MKRSLLTALVFLAVFTSLYGQDEGRFALGFRGGIQIGVSSSHDDYNNFLSANNSKEDVSPNPNLALYGVYGFSDYIGLQTELNFMIDQGKMASRKDDSSATIEMTYSTLDIPILLRINFLSGDARFGILAGPYLTFPLGQASSKFEAYTGVSDSDDDISTPIFGFTAGLFYSNSFMPKGRWIVDLRYLQDFGYSTIKKYGPWGSSDFGFMMRQGIIISVGLDFTL